jgi:hypothetical protein
MEVLYKWRNADTEILGWQKCRIAWLKCREKESDYKKEDKHKYNAMIIDEKAEIQIWTS